MQPFQPSDYVFLFLAIATTAGTVGGVIEHFAAPGSGAFRFGALLASLGVDLASVLTKTGLGSAGAAKVGVLLCTVLAGLEAGAACTPTGAPPTVPGNVVQDVTVGVDAAVCALNHYSSDASAGMSWEATVADVVASCGLPVAKVVGLLDAHQAAETREAGKRPAGHP